MARRLVNTVFTSADETDWTLELWDMNLSSADLDYEVEMDVNGFQITWNGDENDVFQPLLSSACKFTIILNETQRGTIMNVAYGVDEFRMCVKIRKAGQAYWVGQIHSEAIIERVEDGLIYVDMTASDGLAQLENIDFKETDGTVYTTRYSTQAYIYAILKKIPSVSLWYTDSGVGSVFMYEHFLNQPVISDDSFAFSHTDSNSNVRGVLDYLHVDPNTWYLRPNIDERRGDDFKRYPTTKEEGFVSCKMVLHDILASLGATICFSQGTWRIFDRCYLDATTTSLNSASVIQYARTSSGTLEAGTFTEDIDIDIDDTTSEFKRGIVRRGLQPFYGAGQTHVNAGSDLLFASGIGYFDPEVTGALFRYAVTGSGQEWPTDNTRGIWNLAGFTGLDSDANVTNLEIANGANGGAIRLHFSGNCDYARFRPDNPCGTLMILSFKFVVKDTNDVSYALKRRVRTLKYSSTGTEFAIDITGGTGTGDDYYAKFYESDYYEWVASTDSAYNEAYVDVMLGADPSVLNADGVGTTQPFLTQDFPSFAFYTPPGTKLDTSSDVDNQLKKEFSDDRRYFVYRFDHVLDMPQGSATIEEIEMPEFWVTEWAPDQGPDMYYNSSGTSLALGADTGFPNYRTKTSLTGTNGFFDPSISNRPDVVTMFQLSGIEIYNGDGTNEFDNTTIFVPTNVYGNEIYQSPRTHVGGAFVNFGTHVYGRYLVSSYSDPTAREDNFKMITAWDSSDTVERMTQRVNKNVMQMRDRTRQIVEGAMFSYVSNSTIIEPWQRLITTKLSGSSETFIPFRVTLSFGDLEQRLTMMKVRGTVSTVGGAHTDSDKGRTGRSATGGSYNPGGLPDIIGPQLASISFNSSDEITGFTVASGFTPLNADQISDVGTTNKFGGDTSDQELFQIFLEK